MGDSELINNVLKLKGTYYSKNNEQRGGPINLPASSFLDCKKITNLINDLVVLKNYWKDKKLISGFLVNVKYVRVIPKSSRITVLLSEKGTDINEQIVGAIFEQQCHKITYYLLKKDVIDESIRMLNNLLDVCKEKYNGIIECRNFNILPGEKDNNDYSAFKYGKTKFRKLVVECNSIESISYPVYDIKEKTNSIVSFYKTEKNIKKICSELNIGLGPSSIFRELDDEGFLAQIDKNTFDILVNEVPYLISNAGPDLLKIDPVELELSDFDFKPYKIIPGSEPIIGVLDTGYTGETYFDQMVEYKNMLGEDYDPIKENDNHGTEVDSLLVDGSFINGDRYDDECGRFRVKHFSILRKEGEPSPIVIDRIKRVVKDNPNIHVWNISLGSDNPIDKNYISFEANELDKLQYENKEIIFIISGTNLPKKYDIKKGPLKIGAPADSINSLVVNSVNFEGEPASYSREGGVLSFFNKPDICCFGGDLNKAIRVCNRLGEAFNSGTSFAAPWISRKMCFLMDKMNLSRETAKALIIDSAAGWNYNAKNKKYIGYGIVPQKITQILKTRKDEIRFVLSGFSNSYQTYNYNIPIPLVEDRYPFIARATLCYFPSCSRNQGVDYTDTELSLKFGRISDDKNKIIDINDNKQDDEKGHTLENDAREYQRKWDNVKFICSKIKANNRALKSYSNKLWGISITSKQRVKKEIPYLRFSVVVTLREINGKNRIQTFMENCRIKGWNVEEIIINQSNEFYNEIQQDFKFED